MGHGLCQYQRFTITTGQGEALGPFDALGTGQIPYTELNLAARSTSTPWQSSAATLERWRLGLTSAALSCAAR
jgi:hypothetical protein